ncbi:hypothetical protein Tco_1059550 [Tanacetum coccineum]
MRDLRFTLRYENKEYVLDEQIPTIDDDSTQEEIEAHQEHYDDANKAKASMERLNVVKFRMACKPKPGASICTFVLEMKGYFNILESLNMVFDAELSINIILSGLSADYNQFVPPAPMLTVGHSVKKRKTSHSNWKGKAAKGKSDRGSKRKAESEIAPVLKDEKLKRVVTQNLTVDPPKGTLVPRVQLATAVDEDVAKRCGYFVLNCSSRSQVNSAPR